MTLTANFAKGTTVVAKKYDVKSLTEAARVSSRWRDATQIYNQMTGESRRFQSLYKAAVAYGITLGSADTVSTNKPEKKPRVRRSLVEFAKDEEYGRKHHSAIVLRAQRIRLYKECHGIKGHITDDQITEAFEGDVDSWPDAPSSSLISYCPRNASIREPRIHKCVMTI